MAKRFVADASKRGDEFLVVYYIGHGVVKSGGLMLLQGEGDALPLHDLYEALGTDVPFAIVVDACQDDAAFTSLARARGFVLLPDTGSLDYLGDDDTLMHDLSAIGDDLQAAGAAPFLRTHNPVILSAKPGVRARARLHPLWSWGQQVGPMAARIWAAITRQRLSRTRSSLCETLQSVVDLRQGVGEISMTGSVSWSDFSTCLSSAIIPPVASEEVEVSRRINVGAWVSDFAVNGESFLVLDGKFRLLSVSGDGAPPRVVLDEIAASKIRFADGVLYWVTNQHELMRLSGSQPQQVAEHAELSYVGQGHAGRLLGAGDDGQVDTHDRIWRLSNGALQDLGANLGLDDVSDVIEWLPDRFYLASPEKNEIRELQDAKVSIATTADRPAWLSATSNNLYALAENRITLYRLDRSGCLSMADLAGPMRGAKLTRSSWSTRAFVATDDSTFLVGFGEEIVELRVPTGAWSTRTCSNGGGT